ncbi:unnamed protein product [Arctogadus glacialis]
MVEHTSCVYLTQVLNCIDQSWSLDAGITVLLSLTVFMLLVAEIMPATSDSVPLIAQYFASTMMIVGLSVVVTVLVLQFHHHDPHGGKMPKLVRIILLNWCAWFLRMKKPGEDAKTPAACPVHPQPRYSHASAPPHHHASVNSIQMSAVPGQASAHPLSSTHGATSTASATNGSMNLYFGYHSMGTDNPAFPPPSSADSGVMMCAGGGGGGGGAGGGGGSSQASDIHSEHVRTLLTEQVPEIARILEEVQYIAGRFRARDRGDAICGEWKFAAAVVDRLCLVAFSLFSIICTFTILMSAPNFIEAVSKDFT